MTKPAPPPDAELVHEIDAMDLEEWERGQHTPQVGDAKLDALVKQTVEPPPSPPPNPRKTATFQRALAKPAPAPEKRPTPSAKTPVRRTTPPTGTKRAETPASGVPVARADMDTAPGNMPTPAAGTKRPATPSGGLAVKPALVVRGKPPSRVADDPDGWTLPDPVMPAAPAKVAAPATQQMPAVTRAPVRNEIRRPATEPGPDTTPPKPDARSDNAPTWPPRSAPASDRLRDGLLKRDGLKDGIVKDSDLKDGLQAPIAKPEGAPTASEAAKVSKTATSALPEDRDLRVKAADPAGAKSTSTPQKPAAISRSQDPTPAKSAAVSTRADLTPAPTAKAAALTPAKPATAAKSATAPTAKAAAAATADLTPAKSATASTSAKSPTATVSAAHADPAVMEPATGSGISVDRTAPTRDLTGAPPPAQPIAAEPAPRPIEMPLPAPPAPRPIELPLPAPSQLAKPEVVPAPAPEASEPVRPRRWETTDRHRTTRSRRVLIAGAAIASVLVVVIVFAATRGGESKPDAPTTTASRAESKASTPVKPTTPAPVERPPQPPIEPPSQPPSQPTTPIDPLPTQPTANPAQPTTRPVTAKIKKPGKPETTPARPVTTATASFEQARTAYATGNQRLFAGDTDGAIRAYRQAVTLAPGYSAGYRGLGLAYAQRGDKPNALQALRTYVRAAPKARDLDLIKKRIAQLEH